jgi:general stress protein 26
MTKISEADATREFWDHLRQGAPAMLGLSGEKDHLQPMAAYAEEGSNQVWFFTRDDSDLAMDAASRHDGRMVFVSRDRECYADITGDLLVVRDEDRIERYWNAMAAAWFPDGKNDPHLTLLSFSPTEGQVWIVKTGLIRVALQVAKANVSGKQPDLGGSTAVRFPN